MPTIKRLKIAFFGSSLVSSYWNGAAIYYRGIIKALADRGHEVTFYEPDAFERQQHRDIENPDWATVVVYQADELHARRMLQTAQSADIIVKTSGVGVLDEWLEREVLEPQGKSRYASPLKIFWDVDAQATLDRLQKDPDDPFRFLIPRYDFILTYGGGQPVIDAYLDLGANQCHAIHSALDPDMHYPELPAQQFSATLGFLGNRLPDREPRIHEFFFKAVRALPEMQFILGGNGWENVASQFDNLQYVGRVPPHDYNIFNSSPLAVLNINRDSMARTGFSQPTRIFETAGTGACLIMDRWEGAEQFLKPGSEVLLASNGEEVISHLRNLTPEKARQIGEAARVRVLTEHTYRHRALQFEELIKACYPQRAIA